MRTVVAFGRERLDLVRSQDKRRYSAYRNGVLVGAIHPSNETNAHGVWADSSLEHDARAALTFASAALYWFDVRSMREVARALCF